MEGCSFSALPTELRCRIIEELLISHTEFRIGTQYVPRPLERTPGRRIYYKAKLPLAIFQVNRRIRGEAISILSSRSASVDMRYCSSEFVADIKKLPVSALRDAIDKSVVSVRLRDPCNMDFAAIRTMFPRLRRLAFDILGSGNPYHRPRTRRTDGFSVNRGLVPFLRGDFDTAFESLARQDILDYLTELPIDITGLELNIPFRFSTQYRFSTDDYVDLWNCFPGKTLVLRVTHDSFETKISSKYFSKFEINRSKTRPPHGPSVMQRSLDTEESTMLQRSLAVHSIEGISCDKYEVIEIQHSGWCGMMTFMAFDSWLNDRYDYN